ncbi:MAG: hypothetical protein AMXMBFR33_21470 [Candidatus Xenobia bacterium]|jgi:hypothetical protein
MRGEFRGNEFPITVEVNRPQLLGIAASFLAVLLALVVVWKWPVLGPLVLVWLPCCPVLGVWLAERLTRRQHANKFCTHASASPYRCDRCGQRL